MKNFKIFHPPFGNNNRRSLIFSLFALVCLLFAHQSAARGIPAHKLRDPRNPPARLVPWGRRVRSADDAGSQQEPYPIDRPADCGQDQTLYIDCFLCGKVSDEVLIYRYCCERETATVSFCAQLLL